MYSTTLEWDPKFTLHLTVREDLALYGTAEAGKLTLQADYEDEIRIERDGDILRVISLSDLRVDAPAQAQVLVEQVGGDCDIHGWAAPIHVEVVGGDLSLDTGADVSAGRVGGDASVRGAAGEVNLRQVGGDAVVASSARNIKLNAGGDIRIEGPAENISAAAGGDVSARLSGGLDQRLDMKAGGGITVRAAALSDAQISIASGSMDIRLVLGGQRVVVDSGFYHGVIGSGRCQINLKAGGDVILEAQSAEGVLEAKHTVVDGARTFTTPRQDLDDALSTVESELGRGARRAQERLRRAEERIQAAMRRLETRGLIAGGVFRPPVPEAPAVPEVPTVPAQPAPAPAVVDVEAAGDSVAGDVTEEERMLVLKMLQEKKITAEEADRLLAALEGREE